MHNINYIFLIKDCPVVITTLRHPFKILYVNKSWENLCGYKLNEILGKSIFILKHKSITNKIAINRKKNSKLFIHFFEIKKLHEYQISIGKTIFYKDL